MLAASKGREVLESRYQKPAGISRPAHLADTKRIRLAFNTASGASQLKIHRREREKEWNKAREQDSSTPGAKKRSFVRKIK